MITNVYVDLDDVLGDFLNHYYNTFGIRWHDIPNVHERWNNINHYPGWWMEMPLKEGSFDNGMPFNADNLWEDLSWVCEENGIELKVLTATGWNYNSVSVEKKVWCWKNLQITPDKVITVDHARKKQQFASLSAILIDDSVDNINDWNEAGGHGILHISMNGSWSKTLEIISKMNDDK